MKRCNKFVENMVSVILYFSFNAPLVLNQSYYKNNYKTGFNIFILVVNTINHRFQKINYCKPNNIN